ncbi:hypothetical protein EMCRGX_G024858 [Ephydatia muelleri]
MALGRTVYNALFRRTSTFFVTIVVGAVLFERVFDTSTDALWERMNKGKLWKHIKDRYETEAVCVYDVMQNNLETAKMLDLEVIPERALGGAQWELVLGMPLIQALEILKRQSDVIRKVHITYSEQQPLDVDLVVDLVEDGIRLIFDPKCQRLRVIDVYDTTKVSLRYCNKHFCSPEILPTVEQIHNSFGPTLPGEVDQKFQLFNLHFRGLLFTFPLWNSSPRTAELNPEISSFPAADDHRELILSRVCIFSGSDLSEARAPVFPLECFHGNSHAEKVGVARDEKGDIVGLKVDLMMDDGQHSKLGDARPKIKERIVRFGDSPQAISLELGAPSKLFFKQEDKVWLRSKVGSCHSNPPQMRIHSPPPHPNKSSDYFFNYLTLGLDILFDATTHKAKKFILHTNYPGHYDFNIYHRCLFLVAVPVDKTYAKDDSSAKDLMIDSFTKWNDVQEFLTKPTDKPVVLNRSSHTNSSNPFGATHCYGYQNIIFEVMRNSHIATVTIFSR